MDSPRFTTNVYTWAVCPQYIYFLLLQNPQDRYDAVADFVNKEEPCYEDRIIIKFSLKTSDNVYSSRDFRAINPMPV